MEYFKRKEYANNPKEIAKYACWATRGNGPAIFGIPTPISCTVGKAHKNYIVSLRLSCFFQSTHDITSSRLMMSSSHRLSLSSSRNFSSGAKVHAMTMAGLLVHWEWRLLQ
jgi:hypothetical protein